MIRWRLSKYTPFVMRTKGVYLLIFLLLLTPLHWDNAAELPLMYVSFLDVGQGDAIYIEAPNGAQMVIDGGPAGALSGPLSDALPFGDRSINVLMVTNPDTDHYAGFLDILTSGYKIGAVIEPGTQSTTPNHREFQKFLADAAIPELMARRGMTIDLDVEHGVRFTVLFPDRDVSAWTTNDGSIQGILSYGATSIYFTGDGSRRTESLVLSRNAAPFLKSDILKVGHHGSTTSSSEELLAAVAPHYAVISAGKGNRYGLPKESTLSALARRHIETLRTDELGTITFISDGKMFRLKD